jgi:hypothetical protein
MRMNHDEDSQRLPESRSTDVGEHEHPINEVELLRDVAVAEDQIDGNEGIEHAEVKKLVLGRLDG